MLAVRDALVRRQYQARALQAFDLTPAMLDHFRNALAARGIRGIELQQANVLELGALPGSWSNYDLIVSASMLEYIERDRFVDALKALRARLCPEGTFVLFMTRRNLFTRLFIGYWWKSNLYSQRELQDAFINAGFRSVSFGVFPAIVRNMSLWGHIVEAQQ
jgi:cyclopropane fatty-acyl-phospholipid synthase-like methyltransferase